MDDERRRILEMVERGKITSAEADELMTALRASASPPQPAVRRPARTYGEPEGLGLPLSFIITAARWLAVAATSAVFAARWILAWWTGQGQSRRRRRYR